MINIIQADLANPPHAAATVALLNEYACDPMGGGAPLPDYTQKNLVAELHKRPNAHVVLAFDSDKPVGLVTAIEGFSTFSCKPLLNIHDAVVTCSYRGKGICRLMLQKAEELALALGCCKLTLEVLEGNRVAQAAYAAFGFGGYELDPAIGRALFWEKKIAPASAETTQDPA